MEEFNQKWTIVALIEDISEGSEFYFTDVPLHVTLAGVFKIDHDGSWLVSGLTKVLSDQKILRVNAGAKAMFGPNKDVAVTEIVKIPEIIALHNKIHSWLKESDAKYDEPTYEGDGYKPHSTFQKSGSLKEGESRQLESVSIIDLFPNGNGHYRKVFKTIELE